MARKTPMEVLERKIERVQEKVSRAKKQYDDAIAVLSDLLDKRDALKRDELVKAIMRSDRTYDEVIAFLDNNAVEEKSSVRRNPNGKRSRKTKRDNLRQWPGLSFRRAI